MLSWGELFILLLNWYSSVRNNRSEFMINVLQATYSNSDITVTLFQLRVGAKWTLGQSVHKTYLFFELKWCWLGITNVSKTIVCMWVDLWTSQCATTLSTIRNVGQPSSKVPLSLRTGHTKQRSHKPAMRSWMRGKECQPRQYLPGIDLHAMPSQFFNNSEKPESHITGDLQITSVGRAWNKKTWLNKVPEYFGFS